MNREPGPTPRWISRTAQLGQAWIELRVPAEVFWREPLEGVCMVQALATDVWLAELRVDVSLQGDDEGHTPPSVPTQPPCWRDVEVARGERIDLAFSTMIPGGPHGGCGRVTLQARGRRPWSVVWLELPFSVLPPPRLAEFVDAVGMLCGLPQVSWLGSHGTMYDGVAQLRPRGEPHSRLLEVNLCLHEPSGWVSGILEVAVRPSSRFALPDLPDRIPLRFPADDFDAGLRLVAEHLRGYFRERPDLPIPATASANPKRAEFPIPVARGDHGRHELPPPAASPAEESDSEFPL